MTREFPLCLSLSAAGPGHLFGHLSLRYLVQTTVARDLGDWGWGLVETGPGRNLGDRSVIQASTELRTKALILLQL